MRNLLLFVLILVGIWWLRRAFGPKSRGGGGAERPRAGQGEAGGEAAMERMVECAHCGVHVPESEGVSDAGRFYCSEAHRRLGPGRSR